MNAPRGFPVKIGQPVVLPPPPLRVQQVGAPETYSNKCPPSGELVGGEAIASLLSLSESPAL